MIYTYKTNMEPDLQPPQQAHNPWIVPFSIIVAGALIGAGIYFSSTAPKNNEPNGYNPQNEVINLIPVNDNDHILGNPNAPVIIVEFSDSECPYCKDFHKTMKRVMSEYGQSGKVAWIYRQYPIAELHPLAPKQAEGLECASEIGGNTKFWDLVNAIYERPASSVPLDQNELVKLGASLGLDEKKFSDCVQSGRTALKIQEDAKDAINAGMRGTPHSILVTKSGEKIAIRGAQPYDVMKTLIEAALETETD
jgi:protein-disulfide isomerase